MTAGMAGTRAAFERFMAWTIRDERGAIAGSLPPGEAEEFLRYYRDLPGPHEDARIARYLRGLWRTEAGWTSRWIGSFAAARGRAPHVLDAGSGFGTYSMLFAAVGAEVTGVDLRPDRLDAAGRRLAFHGARTGERLAVRYLRADLTAEWPGDVDLVWVYNALSHIEPLDAFLDGVRRHLRPGGVLVVGDINGAHPGQIARLRQVRTEVHQEYVAPDGRRHAYAVERPFPPEELRQLARRHGLRVAHHELFLFAVSRLPEPLYGGLLAPLQRAWRLGRRVARRQLFVAARDGS